MTDGLCQHERLRRQIESGDRADMESCTVHHGWGIGQCLRCGQCHGWVPYDVWSQWKVPAPGGNMNEMPTLADQMPKAIERLWNEALTEAGGDVIAAMDKASISVARFYCTLLGFPAEVADEDITYLDGVHDPFPSRKDGRRILSHVIFQGRFSRERWDAFSIAEGWTLRMRGTKPKSSDEWIATKDGLPSEGQEVLAYLPVTPSIREDGTSWQMRVVFFRSAPVEGNNRVPYEWEGPGPFKEFGQCVPYWKPLPDLPKE